MLQKQLQQLLQKQVQQLRTGLTLLGRPKLSELRRVSLLLTDARLEEHKC